MLSHADVTEIKMHKSGGPVAVTIRANGEIIYSEGFSPAMEDRVRFEDLAKKFVEGRISETALRSFFSQELGVEIPK